LRFNDVANRASGAYRAVRTAAWDHLPTDRGSGSVPTVISVITANVPFGTAKSSGQVEVIFAKTVGTTDSRCGSGFE